MLKRSILFLPLALLLGAAVAQSRHGPRLGLGLATQSVGGLFQNTSNLMPAPLFGWGYEAQVHEQVFIMPELLWMTKGAVTRNQTQKTRSRTALHYLELPVMAKISTDAKPDGVFLTVGPSIGYYVGGNYKSWLDGDLVSDIDYDASSSDNRWQFSMAVGMGYDQPRWYFEIRAQSSLTPFSATTDVQNIVYAVAFGWRFEVKKKQENEQREEP